jgi:hypothetical protein
MTTAMFVVGNKIDQRPRQVAEQEVRKLCSNDSSSGALFVRRPAA